MTTKTAIYRVHGDNGRLPLKSAWLGLFPSSWVHGGPFRHAPVDFDGVCLLEKALTNPRDPNRWFHLPIQDFSVPSDDAQVRKALRHVFSSLLRGRNVYVGCMGGFGRTGLMMALIAKVMAYPDPVQYVRTQYTKQAVETRAQEAYVENFDVKSLRRWLLKEVIKNAWRRFL